MKVLQINSVCGIGSTGRIATDIHQMLLEQGHESYIAYGRGEAMNCDNVIKIGNKMDQYTHVALTRVFDRHGFGSVKSTKEFIKEIEALNPDVIHLHNIHGYYLNIEVLFKYLKKANKPVIWTLHDCWSFTGHCSHFDYVGCPRWQTGCHDCPEKNEYPQSRFIDASKKNHKDKKGIFTGVKNLMIITPSKWLANLVKVSYLDGYPVKVINNGIDLNVFKPTIGEFRKKHGIEKKFVILGVASIWTKRKGYDYFIELAQLLAEDEVIVMLGLSSEQIKVLPENIIGIKRTNNITELAEIYSTSDVFMNPTLEDTFPTTNLEALACGTPVITFDTGGSPEAVENGEVGIITCRKDVKAIRVAIEKSKDIQSNKCHEYALTHFSKQEKFAEYLRLYQSLFNKK